MADRTFDVTKIRGATRHQAARAVILPALVPNYRQISVDDALEKVRRDWRFRVVKLMEAGYRPLTGYRPGKRPLTSDECRVQLQYFRNCPPVGVDTSTKTFPCNRDLVCPFCWSRGRALEAFISLEHAIYGSWDDQWQHRQQHIRMVPPEGLQLVAFTTRHWWGCRMDVPEPLWLSSVYSQCSKGPLHQTIRNRTLRQVERHILNADMAFVSHRISFVEGQRVLQLGRCGLALTRNPPDEATYRAKLHKALKRSGLPQLPEDIRCENFGPPTRNALLRATCFALTYPRSMLYHDANVVTMALNGLMAKTVRMVASYGLNATPGCEE